MVYAGSFNSLKKASSVPFSALVVMLALSLASCDPTTASGSSFKVSYDANGATSGTVPTDSGTYDAGTTVTVLGNTGNLTKTGYSFSGWNTAASGSGTSYAAGATFAIGSADITLYASWKASTSTSWKKCTTKIYSSTDTLQSTTVSVRDGTTLTASNYDASGAASGSVVSTFNDSDKLIKQVSYDKDGSVLATRTITYNSAQQVIRQDLEYPASPSMDSYLLTTYDGSGASTQKMYTKAGELQATTVATWDSYGNPLKATMTMSSGDSMTSTYTYEYNSAFLIMKATAVLSGTGAYSSSSGTAISEYERDSLGRETKISTTINGSKSNYSLYTYES